MKSVMLTIRLKWFYLTYKGIKTVEVRKSCPKNFNGDVFEVVSKTNFEKDLMEIPENEREFFRQFKGKVGLKFTLNKVEEIEDCVDILSTKTLDCIEILKKSCLFYEELHNYLPPRDDDKPRGYAWHISNLEIFDKPKELNDFYRFGVDEWAKKHAGTKIGYVEFWNTIYDFKLTKAPQSWCHVEEMFRDEKAN